MAIDPNIALNVRPIEQPNMLGQMAQAMAIRQAQQQYEGSEGVNELARQGNKDPYAYLQYGPQGRATYESILKGQKDLREGQKLEVDLGIAKIGAFRDQLNANVNDPAAAARWLTAVNGDPLVGKILSSVPLQDQIAGIPTDPKGFADWKNRTMLKAPDFVKHFIESADAQLGASSRIQAANISAGPANRRLDYDIANPQQHFFTGADNTLMTAPQRGGGGARPVPMAGTSAPPPQVTIGGGGGATPMGGGSSIMVSPAPINNLAPFNQNALITQPQPTPAPAAPTFAQVRATPVTKDIVDPTDPSGRRMITVEVNTYKAGTGLGVDGNQAAPAGVLGVATSQIPPNYLRDPNNPQGVIPVPGSAADPNASVPSGYRKTAAGNLKFIPGGAADPSTVVPPNYRRAANGIDLEFIPGGPADPKVMAAKTTVTLSAKDKEAREAKYPQATSALKGFEAKTKQFDSVINELIENKKGLDEITGFFAGRTDVSAMSDAGRRALSLFNTITAKGGFSELQAMRNASPTGGALGNVSNQEGQQLINSFGALARTQSGDDLRKSLATAKSDLQNLKERMREAYDLTYEYKNSSGGFTYLGKE